jgi:hypothetical protein
VDIDDEALVPFRAVGRGRATEGDIAAVQTAVANETPLASPDNGRVLLAGDWHGNTAHAVDVVRWAVRVRAATVVQIGDFGFSANGEGHL